MKIFMRSFTPLEFYKELRKFKVQSRNSAILPLYSGITERRGRILTGFTLVEVIIYSVIIVIVLGIIAEFTVSFYQTNRYFISQKQAVFEARQSLDTMVKDIREAGFSQTGAYPIENAQNYTFSFFKDENGDGVIEKITFSLTGTNLTKEVRNPDDSILKTIILSSAVRNIGQSKSLFRYYNASNQLVADPSVHTDIRVVNINLIVNVDVNAPPNELFMTTWVGLRNIK